MTSEALIDCNTKLIGCLIVEGRVIVAMLVANFVSYEIYFHFELEYFWLILYQICCRPYFLIVILSCLSVVDNVYIHARFMLHLKWFHYERVSQPVLRSFATCFADKRLNCLSNNISDQNGRIIHWCAHLCHVVLLRNICLPCIELSFSTLSLNCFLILSELSFQHICYALLVNPYFLIN